MHHIKQYSSASTVYQILPVFTPFQFLGPNEPSYSTSTSTSTILDVVVLVLVVASYDQSRSPTRLIFVNDYDSTHSTFDSITRLMTDTTDSLVPSSKAQTHKGDWMKYL